MSDDDSQHLTCLLAFDTDHQQFARGFEAGRIWSLLCKHPGDAVDELAHVANAEMLLRMAESTGRPVISREVDDTWIAIRFDPAGA